MERAHRQRPGDHCDCWVVSLCVEGCHHGDHQGDDLPVVDAVVFFVIFHFIWKGGYYQWLH